MANLPNSNESSPNLNFNRPKPSNIEAEEAVLGAMLLAPQMANQALTALKFDGAFFRPAHQTIFNAMLELDGGKHEAALDPVVLADHLQRNGQLEEVGGREYISNLMDRQVTAANIEHYIDIVRNNAMLRKIINACNDTVDKCYDQNEDVTALMDNVEQKIFEITAMNEKKELQPISKLVLKSIEYLDALTKGSQEILGLKTGFEFDRLITGLKPGDLFVIAARPSVGKTALALNIATNMAAGEQRIPVGFFSIEMPAMQIVLRIICSMSRLGMTQIRKRQYSMAQWNDLIAAAQLLQDITFIIDDTGGIDILELRAKARRMKKKYNIQALFIDYLQLIKVHSTNKNMSRENEVAQISGALKALAKELEIPIIVLAQLNRDADKDETPKLSQLRESGAIEQDADIVAILHRPSKKQEDNQGQDESKPQPVELHIAKNRNGAIGKQMLLFHRGVTRFENATMEDDE